MAEAKGAGLREWLLGDSRVMEYLGRNLVSKPQLLGALPPRP